MKQLLRDRELLNIVLEFVHDTQFGRRSLSRLARTCRGLSDPCLNVLWRELDSLLPLLSLLPNDLFKRPRRPGLGFVSLSDIPPFEASRIKLQAKNPAPNDWKRLMAYGERVEKITYNETVGNVSGGIFSVLEECKPQEYILPNVQTLVWRVETPEGLERSLLFLTPQLRNIIVDIGAIQQEELRQFLVEIATHTHLLSLAITSPTKVPQDLPNILGSQSSLEKVVLMAPGALAPPIGRWLASLKNLKSFQVEPGDRSDDVVGGFFNRTPRSLLSPQSSVVTLDSRSSSDDGSASPSPSKVDGSMVFVDMPQFDGFASLQHVHVTGDISTVTTFLGHMNSPLQSIELALDEPRKEKEWRNLWSTISHQFGHSLRSLSASATGNSRFADLIRATARGENAARHLPLDGMQDLHELVRLELDLPESRVFYDDDLKHLSAACPNLEVAKLCPLSRWPQHHGAPKVTLAGLAPLMANCKRLHTLNMALYAAGTTDNSIFDLAVSSHSLIRMHVGHSWVGDPLQAAIVLSHLAPRVESLKWFHERNRPGYIEANSVGWQKVSEIFPQLQRLRLHERRQVQALLEQPPPPKVQEVKVVPTPPPPEPKPEPPKVVKENKGTQTEVKTKEFSIQVQPTMRHKSVSVKASIRNAGVDATPTTVDSEVDAVPKVTEQEVDVRPVMVSQATETVTMLPMTIIDKGYPNGSHAPASTLGYVGSLVYQAIRAVSPPILFRLLDLWAMPGAETRDDYPSEVLSPMRSTMMFNNKISPVCH